MTQPTNLRSTPSAPLLLIARSTRLKNSRGAVQEVVHLHLK